MADVPAHFDAHELVELGRLQCMDTLVRKEGAWCLAGPGEAYVVYLPTGDGAKLELSDGTYSVSWFNPREGGELLPGQSVKGPGVVELGKPPRDEAKDWVVLVKREKS